MQSILQTMQKRYYKQNRFILLFLFFLQTATLFGQIGVDSLFSRIEERFITQLDIWPQEKIHLHTDRDFYVPGEKIWFKAYLTDAATHQHSTQSRYVYVELISPVDTLIRRVMIRPENGMFYGNLFLSELIPEGNYTIRAYTRYMDNLGDDYFFKKNIRIGYLNGGNGGNERNRENRGNGGNEENRGRNNANRINTSTQTNLSSRGNQDDFDVSFFPEGGNLVEGLFNTIAFKALNRRGYPETITGIIVDENDAEITSVQTFYAGMGVFSCMPEKGKRYRLKCKNENGIERQFMLPQPVTGICALTVSQQNRKILVGLRKSANTPDLPCYLLVHCRGMVLYFAPWNPKNEALVFSEEDLPSGVIQFVLFDEQMNPLSERLAFNKNFVNDVETVEFHTDKSFYKQREKVIATIRKKPSLPPVLSGKAGEGLLSSFSIAITDDADIAIDSSTTILSSLLLSSELKGYIENPAYYMQDNIQSATALDYLMMTHGWKRYNVPEVAKGNINAPKIPFQTSQEISGKVRGAFLRPVADSEVLIMTEDGNNGITSTDEAGNFMFRDFEYPDSTSFFIQALSRRGNRNVELVLNEESFPKPLRVSQSPHLISVHFKGEDGIKDEIIIEHDPNAFIMKAELRSRYNEDMQVIHLNEIEVTAKRIERKIEHRLEYYMSASADKTIQREEIEELRFILWDDFVNFIRRKYFRRGPNSLSGVDEPLIFFDGVAGGVTDFPMELIESVDIFNGVGASIFGVRGASGVISITTKRGVDDRYFERDHLNYIVFTPLGYQKPIEFYSHKYETLESKYLTLPDFRTTIFWKPDIFISDDNEEASFEFYTSDFSTTYSVVIEGLTSDGRIVRQVGKIRVE